jgi:hypothetical protein
MSKSTKNNIPKDELSQQAKSYVEDCLLDGPTKISIVMTKEVGKETWSLVCDC